MSVFNLKVLVAQSCPTLCNPMNCSLLGSSIHRILQARILEWVAISFPRGSSLLRDLTRNKLANTLWIMKEVTGEERRKARMNPSFLGIKVNMNLWILMQMDRYSNRDVCISKPP